MLLPWFVVTGSNCLSVKMSARVIVPAARNRHGRHRQETSLVVAEERGVVTVAIDDVRTVGVLAVLLLRVLRMDELAEDCTRSE